MNKSVIIQLLIMVVLIILLIFINEYTGVSVLTGDIPDQNLEVNQIKDINLFNYFSGINLTFSSLPMENIDILIDEGIATITPDEGFIGESSTIFTAYENGSAVNSNVVSIIVGDVNEIVSEELFNIPVVNETIIEEIPLVEETFSSDSEFGILTIPTVADTQIILPYTLPYSNSSILNCSAEVDDVDRITDEKLNISFRWYRNDVDQIAFYGNATDFDITGGAITVYGPVNVTNITKYENYTCGATSWDGDEFSVQLNSTIIEILNTPPNHTNPILNSSTELNYSYENLTIYNQSTQDADGDNVTNLYRWYLNDEPLAMLYLPFEGENTSSNKTLDYSGRGFVGNTTIGANATTFWNSSGGVIDFHGITGGAYEFNNYTAIELPDTNSQINLNIEGTIEVWIKPAIDNQTNSVNPSLGVRNDGWILSKSGNYTEGSAGGSANDFSYLVSFRNETFIKGILSSGVQPTFSVVSTSKVINVGNWYHVVFTWNSTHGSIYINGTLDNYEINENLTYPSQNNFSVIVGNAFPRNPDYGKQGFNGTIDEVRIYNFSVSSDYINWSYNNGNPKYNTLYAGETTKNENYTGSICLIDGNISGVCLNTTSLVIVNFIPNQTKPILNTTISSTGNGENRSSENLTAYPQGITDLDVEDNVTAIFNWYESNVSLAVAILPFDIPNKTNFSWDYSNNGNNANITNVTWNASGGISGGGYEFNGTNGQMINISNPINNLGTSGETWELWFKSHDVTKNQFVINRGIANNRFTIQVSRTSSSKKIQWWDDINNKNYDGATGRTILENDQWYHLVFTCNNTDGKKLYLNGELEINSPHNLCSSYAPYEINIGNWIDGTGPFDGTIDEVRIYPKALGIDQIRAHYSEGNSNYSKIVSQQTRKGEMWHVEVIPNDGQDIGNGSNSTALEILNQIPFVQNVTITPSAARKETVLYGYGDYGDPDDDSERNSTLRWYIDDVAVTQQSTSSSGWNSTQLLLCHFNELNNTCDNGRVRPVTAPDDNISIGKYGNSTNINVGDDLAYDENDNINIDTGTIEMWVNKSVWDDGDINNFLGMDLSGLLGTFIFRQDTTGLLQFGYVDAALHQTFYNISNLTANESHYFAVAWNTDNGSNSEVHLYVDGRNVNNTFDDDDADPIGRSLDSIQIGSYNSEDYLNGSIDELRISNRILNGDEILRNYQLGRQFHDNEYQFYNTSYTTGSRVTFEYCPDDAVNNINGICVNDTIIIQADVISPPGTGKKPVPCKDECDASNYPICVDDNTKRECISGGTEECPKNILQDTSCGGQSCINGACGNCGNNIVDSGEECDSGNLNGKTCNNLNYLGGDLSCSNCKLDTSNCFYDLCNNDILDPGEEWIDCGGNCRDCTDEEREDKGRIFCVQTMGMTELEIAELGPLFNLIPCNITEVDKIPNIKKEYKCGGVDLTIEESVRLRTNFLTNKPIFLLNLIESDKFEDIDNCPWCYDNILNYDETGIDCGGSCGPCLETPKPIDLPSRNFGLLIFFLFIILILAIIFYHSYDDKKIKLISLIVFFVDSVSIITLVLLDVLNYSISLESFVILSSIIILYGTIFKLVYKYSSVLFDDIISIEKFVKRARRETKIDKLFSDYFKNNFGYKGTKLESVVNKFKEVIKKK